MALFLKAGALADDLQMQAHWAAYVCTLTSGLLEVGVRDILGAYASGSSAPTVSNYVERQLSRVQNPNMAKILEVVGSFDIGWAEALTEATNGRLKESVDSVIAVRHQVAHGGNTGLTLGRARQYFDDSVKVLELLNSTCR